MRRLIVALVVLTALAVLAGFGGRWLPILDLAAAFRLHLAVLAGALAAAAAAARHWRPAGLAAGAALIAAASLGPVLEAPASRGAGDGGRPLTLLYGNVHEANPGSDELWATLMAQQADVLVTSETPAALAARLAKSYPYRLVADPRGGTVRTALWSRFPLRRGRLHLNNTIAPTGASAVLDLGEGREVGLIGVHFSRATEAVQPRQIAGLGEIAAGLPRPLVVIGDFNAAPWSATLSRAARLTGTRVAGGYRITWRGAYQTPLGALPEPWGQQIDQLLVSEGVGIEAIGTVALPGSDHAGLLARLHLPAR